ncbi:MAG: nucleotidyltransferase family protein [Candidatus Aerophobetes bacterium]|nr:nucleotidyltransferase family protein [Candidatus Aerophobetes bacterium]
MKITLTEKASYLLNKSPAEIEDIIVKSIHFLKINPEAGLKLYKTFSGYRCYDALDGIKIFYTYTGMKITIISIYYPQTLVTSAQDKISAVILAAGKEDCRGVPAQLFPIKNEAAISKCVNIYRTSGISDLNVVLGYKADVIKRTLLGKDIKVVVNKDYLLPMSHSLKAGLKLISPNVNAVFIALGDQPFVNPEVITILVDVYRRRRPLIVSPEYMGKRGHPVLFDSKLIPELLRVRNSRGGVEVVQKYQSEMIEVRVNDEGVAKDLSQTI